MRSGEELNLLHLLLARSLARRRRPGELAAPAKPLLYFLELPFSFFLSLLTTTTTTIPSDERNEHELNEPNLRPMHAQFK